MNTTQTKFERNTFSRDLAKCLRLADHRKAEIAAAKARILADEELRAVLLGEANRRGHTEIDWPEYFRNLGLY